MNSNILVEPEQLRRQADEIEDTAKRVLSHVEQIDHEIRTSDAGFRGQLADDLMSRYRRSKDQMETWHTQLIHFSKLLRVAADRFERADKDEFSKGNLAKNLGRQIAEASEKVSAAAAAGIAGLSALQKSLMNRASVLFPVGERLMLEPPIHPDGTLKDGVRTNLADGVFVGDDGALYNADKQLVDANGNILDETPNKDIKLLKSDSLSEGVYVSPEGVLVNENGESVNIWGEPSDAYGLPLMPKKDAAAPVPTPTPQPEPEQKAPAPAPAPKQDTPPDPAPKSNTGGTGGSAPHTDTSGAAPDASAGGAPDASAGGAPDASAGGAPDASAGGAPDASAGGAPDASAGGAAPDASAGGAPDASAGGAPDASAGGAAPDASAGGAPDASAGGAPDASAGGAPDASAAGTGGGGGSSPAPNAGMGGGGAAVAPALTPDVWSGMPAAERMDEVRSHLNFPPGSQFVDTSPSIVNGFGVWDATPPGQAPLPIADPNAPWMAPEVRTSGGLTNIIEYLNPGGGVDGAPLGKRYIGSHATGAFLRDAMNMMGVDLGGNPLNLQEQLAWIQSNNPVAWDGVGTMPQGWISVSPEMAQQLANQGYPALQMADNHGAVVIPEIGSSRNGFPPFIAMGGMDGVRTNGKHRPVVGAEYFIFVH